MMMSNKLWDPPLCLVHEHIHIYFNAQSILHENNSAPSNYPLYLTQPVGINPHLLSPQDKDLNFPPSNDRDVFFIVFHAVLNIILWSVASHMSFFYINSDATRFVFVSEVFQLCLYIYIYIFLIFHKRPTWKRGTVKDTGSGVLR